MSNLILSTFEFGLLRYLSSNVLSKGTTALGGLVVSVLAFYSNNVSSNPAGYLKLLYKKTKINEKEAGVGPSLKKCSELLDRK